MYFVRDRERVRESEWERQFMRDVRVAEPKRNANKSKSMLKPFTQALSKCVNQLYMSIDIC